MDLLSYFQFSGWQGNLGSELSHVWTGGDTEILAQGTKEGLRRCL